MRQTNRQNEAFCDYANASNYSTLYVKAQFVPHRKHGLLPLENQSINAEQGNNGCLKITWNTNTWFAKNTELSVLNLTV